MRKEDFDLIAYVGKKHPELTEQLTEEQLKINEDYVEHLTWTCLG